MAQDLGMPFRAHAGQRPAIIIQLLLYLQRFLAMVKKH